MLAAPAGQAHAAFPAALSSASTPSSPTFPAHQSLSLNGAGQLLAIRPSPPNHSASFVSAYTNSPASDIDSPRQFPPRSYLDFVHTWDDEHVARWLTEVGAGGHSEAFARNDIRGSVLLDVDQSALKEMGIRSVGDRVRITVAIKQLRQKCSQRTVQDSQSPTRSSFNLAQQPGSRHSATRSSGKMAPPPLRFADSNTDFSTTSHSPSSSRPGTALSNRYPPPSQPPPQSRLPPAPGQSPPAHPTSLPRAPAISTTAASPTAAINSSVYNLQRANSSSGLSSLHRANSTSPSAYDRARAMGAMPPRPSTGALPGQSSLAHRRSQSNSAQQQTRPSTTPNYYGHNQPLSSHPFGPAANSPTQDGFNVPSYGRAPTNLSLAPSPALTAASALSPVTESAKDGYSVGRGGFSRPTTHGGLVGAGGVIPGSGSGAGGSVMIRFFIDDGVSKLIAVHDCRDGKDVLVRALRKFGKLGPYDDEIDKWAAFSNDNTNRRYSENELLGFAKESRPQLNPRELRLRNAGKAQRMLGEHSPLGSTRPGGVASSSPTSPGYLGVDVPYTNIEPASPSGSSASGQSERRLSVEPGSHDRGKMNRASTISVMSGLGVGEGYLDVAQPTTRSSSSGAALAGAGRLRSFFGQRPPSELITNHLMEYFPKAEKNKLLSKQLRQSMRRSMVRRDSRSSTLTTATAPAETSWEKAPDRFSLSPNESRFSGSSGGSGQAVADDASVISVQLSSAKPPLGTRLSSGSASGNLLAPPEEGAEGEDDDDDAGSVTSSMLATSNKRMSRRASGSSRLSVWGKKGSSDTASIVTVDDITAELEHRRASMVSFVDSDEENDKVYIPGLAHHLRPPSIALSRGDEDEDDLDDVDDDESTEEESTEEEEEAEELPKDPAKPAKPALKWIKGALIGVGAFGSVFLGMNPLSGSLMAVKQVELPTGNSHNEERKKNMLEALEREIELLKVLQHDNIVQYLDSSSDATHLNIFLEYVPGGSVAALLSNYGAFEEALVSKFVRQILTGLDYLHEREIIHRDIKGANILVDNKGGIKISDFGISKKVEDNLLTGAKVHRPSLQGSVYWMAPEVVKQTAYTSKADIWSLGCLVVEMLTGAHPWANLTQMQAIFRIGSSIRPTIPDDISDDADDFLEQTFMIDHLDRPSAKDLLGHAFIREEPAQTNPTTLASSQQTPTRATFSQTAA